jgi:Rrf2 family protein
MLLQTLSTRDFDELRRPSPRCAICRGGATWQAGAPMRISFAAWYDLRALAYLARPTQGAAVVTSQAIAEHWGTSGRFLSHVLRQLAAARVLLSHRGTHGGYRLARPARSITLLEVVEAVDGPIRGAAPAIPGDTDALLRRRIDQICGEVAELPRTDIGLAVEAHSDG